MCCNAFSVFLSIPPPPFSLPADEIEEHFQRSLAKIKQQQQQQLQSDSLKQQPSILSKSLLSDTHKITVTENNSLSTSPNNNAPGSPQQQRNHQQQQQQQQQHRQRMIAKPTVVLPASTSAVTAINSQLNVATASVPKSPRQHHKTPLTPQKTAVTPLHTFSTLSSSSSSPSPSPAVPTIVSIPNASTFTQQPFLVTTSQGPQVFNPATATVLQTPGGGLQLIDLTKSLAQNAVVSSNVSSAMGAGGAQFSFTSLPAGGQNLPQGATTPLTPKTPQKNGKGLSTQKSLISITLFVVQL